MKKVVKLVKSLGVGRGLALVAMLFIAAVNSSADNCPGATSMETTCNCCKVMFCSFLGLGTRCNTCRGNAENCNQGHCAIVRHCTCNRYRCAHNPCGQPMPFENDTCGPCAQSNWAYLRGEVANCTHCAMPYN